MIVVSATLACVGWGQFDLPHPANENVDPPPAAPAGASSRCPPPEAGTSDSTPKCRLQAQTQAQKKPSKPASIRFNNPGAQYPARWAKAFGMDGFGIIGGGHLIAHFPDPIAGAAANMTLLSRSYVGMTIGAAGAKWTGGNGFGVPGYDPNQVLTSELLNNATFVIPLMKAIAKREAGKDSPLTDDQWVNAFKAFQTGRYPA